MRAQAARLVAAQARVSRRADHRPKPISKQSVLLRVIAAGRRRISQPHQYKLQIKRAWGRGARAPASKPQHQQKPPHSKPVLASEKCARRRRERTAQRGDVSGPRGVSKAAPARARYSRAALSRGAVQL